MWREMVNFLMSSVWDWSLLQTAKTTRWSAYLNLPSSAVLIYPSWVVDPAAFCAIWEHNKCNNWTNSNLVHTTEKKNCTHLFCYHTYCCHPIVYFQTVWWWTKEGFGVSSGQEAVGLFYKYSLSRLVGRTEVYIFFQEGCAACLK